MALFSGALASLGELPVYETTLERGLGLPVSWEALVQLGRDGKDLETLGRCLERGASEVEICLESESVQRKGALSRVEFEDEASQQIRIQVETTRFSEHAKDSHQPRWRVHKAANLYLLMKKFSDVVRLDPDLASVENRLADVRFSVGNKACIIQAGKSDWEFVGEILGQFSRLLPSEGPMLVTGSTATEGGDEDTWMVTWAKGESFASEARAVSTRSLDKPPDAYEFYGFENRLAPIGSTRTRPTPTTVWRRPIFGSASWRNWSKLPLPCFVGERLAWRLRDRICQVRKGDALTWQTQLDFVDSRFVFAGAAPAARFQPWVGQGVVKSADANSPWIEITLDGFSGEKGEDTLLAYLGTPYSGPDGALGLHLVPEDGTRVLVAWSGFFEQPPVVLGNVREKDILFPSPSLNLSKTAKLKLAKVKVESIGDIGIDSSLSLKVNKPVDITGDEAELSLKEGVIYLGKPGL